ncbi:FAD-dependent oxidoreductase [Planctomycetota bacterium]
MGKNVPEIQYTRNIPVRYKADIAVIGGGIAGVCAACTAADLGASVILVERFAVTGGMMTAGGVNNFCGETAGQGSVFDEVITGLQGFGAVADYQPYNHFKTIRPFDHEILSVVLQEILVRHGVKMLLHTRFVDTVMKSNRITELVLRGQSGPEGLQAALFVDATGEGEVAHLAGFETMRGRASDKLQLPMSLMFFVRETDEDPPDTVMPEGWAEPLAEHDLPMTSIWPNGPKSKAVKIKVAPFDSTDTESMTAAEIRARRRMIQVLDYYQRKEGKKWRLDHASPIIGIREGRRVIGDYILTEEDVRSGQEFDDGVAVGTFYIDAHEPVTEKRVDQLEDPDKKVVPPYHIPFRALIARDGINLLTAGRCLSADQLAMASARVATSCAMMGQAAGTAAACAVKDKCKIRDVDPQDIRSILGEGGSNLDLSGRPTSKES